MNSVQLHGRLVKDVDLQHTESDLPYCMFTIAVYKTKDTTNFIDCVAWEKTAELITKFLKKGDKITCSGSVNIFKNKENHNVMNILVDKLYF